MRDLHLGCVTCGMKWQCWCCLLLLPPTSHSLSSGQGAHPSSGTFGPQLQTKNKPQPTYPHCLRFPGKAVKRGPWPNPSYPPEPHQAPKSSLQLSTISSSSPDTVRQNHQRRRLAQGTLHTQPIQRDPTPPHLTQPLVHLQSLLTTPPLPSRHPHLTRGLLQSQLVS